MVANCLRDSLVIYLIDKPFFEDSTMAILPRAGRAAIAAAIKDQPLHLAWGPGLASWGDNPPPENADATALISEIGRRKVTSAQYVVPDSGGDYEFVTGADGSGNPITSKFSISTEPTNRLLVSTRFDFSDAPSAVIRQFGLFVGTQTIAGLPPGQMYFTPGEIADPGRLLQLENCKPIYRSASTRELREFLIVF